MNKNFFHLGVRVLSLMIIVLNIPQIFAENHYESASSIITIENFEELDTYIKQIPSDTLLILDIDYTLFQPMAPAFQRGNFSNNAEFIKKFLQTLPKNLKSEFSTSIVTSTEPQLIEESAPQILKKFEQKGIRLLALSAVLTGQWKDIKDVMEWRLDTLKKAEIPLSDFGFDSVYKFKNLSAYKENYAEIKEGVLLTNGETLSKSEVLQALLNKIKWKPKKIIFVDDTKSLLEDMETYAQNNKISFLGFEYKGAKRAKFDVISKQDFEKIWTQLLNDIQSS